MFKVGNKVLIPWGPVEEIPGTIVEVWGDPATHVRVAFEFDGELQILLLSPDIVRKQPPPKWLGALDV